MMKRFTILNMKKNTLFDQRRNFKYNYTENKIPWIRSKEVFL